tara:strand:- start:265 stop:948 length:684 start_codon:yes stop_codon:yes gene_type:complete
MSGNKDEILSRRSVLTGLGLATAGMAVTTAAANESESGFTPARYDQDAWMGELPGKHRVFMDSSSPKGGAVALLYANNIMNAHASAYDGQDSDYALIVCLRHYSTVLAFDDSVWKKYGEGIHEIVDFPDPETGEAPTVNLVSTIAREGVPNGGNTIEASAARGIQLAVCDNAATVISQGLSSMGFGAAEDIYADFKASAVPNSRFVSAGVMAATRAQEYGYTFMFAD